MATLEKINPDFVKVERALGLYFYSYIAPIITSQEEKYTSSRAREAKDFSLSVRGVLEDLVPVGSTSSLQITGEWNSKRIDDFINDCKDRILSTSNIVKDLREIAMEFRSTVIDQVGRPKYDELSYSLGCDLANAYIQKRVDEMLLDSLINKNIPTSSMDYIISKAARCSLFSLGQEFTKSDLEREIEEKEENRYNPTKLEKATAFISSIATDTIATYGTGSWGTLLKTVAVDGALISGVSLYESSKKKEDKTLSSDEILSLAIFEKKENVFSLIRKEANKPEDNYDLSSLNLRLKNKIPLGYKKIPFIETPKYKMNMDFFSNDKKEDVSSYDKIPSIIPEEKREDYLAFKSEERERGEQEKQKIKTQDDEDLNVEASKQNAPQESAKENNSDEFSFWEGALNSFGLDSMGDLLHNLPYVLATIPDMIVGLFTGKTQSVSLKKDILPIASILIGFFIKNPILKMALIGMGGANLINKMGHEALEEYDDKGQKGKVFYKKYEDEELSSRIKSPEIKGRRFVAIIDDKPRTCILPQEIEDAYEKGFLPLNVLSNHILKRIDALEERSISLDKTKEIAEAKLEETSQERPLIHR